MLEQEGYALAPITEIDDPLFFTGPYQERLVQFTDQAPAALTLLGLSLPCTMAQVKAAYRKRVKQFHPDHGGSHEEIFWPSSLRMRKPCGCAAIVHKPIDIAMR